MTILALSIALWLAGVWYGYQLGQGRERRDWYRWLDSLTEGPEDEPDVPEGGFLIQAPDWGWLDDNGANIRPEPRQ